MKSIKPKRFTGIFVLFAFTLLFSSCNRGYGCPTDFSSADSLLSIAQNLLSVIF